jgi:hypothetical protein
MSIIWVYDYASTTTTKHFTRFSKVRNSSNEIGVGMLFGVYGTTTPVIAITSVQFIHGTGAADFGGGTVRIYGVK